MPPPSPQGLCCRRSNPESISHLPAVIPALDSHPCAGRSSLCWVVIPVLGGHPCTRRSSLHWVVIPVSEGHPCARQPSLYWVVIPEPEGHPCVGQSSLYWVVIPVLEGHPCTRRSSLREAVIPPLGCHPSAGHAGALPVFPPALGCGSTGTFPPNQPRVVQHQPHLFPVSDAGAAGAVLALEALPHPEPARRTERRLSQECTFQIQTNTQSPQPPLPLSALTVWASTPPTLSSQGQAPDV